jgi:hypothetical protein
VGVTEIVLLIVGILVIAALTLGIIFGVLYFVARPMARRRGQVARQQYPDARLVDETASFFGQESRGAGQMRGNGTLIVTDSEIIFQQWVTNREFRIPLRSIQSIENPTSFLGKSRFAPLLKISYLDDTGRVDSMAWQVRDLSGAQRVIEEARGEAAD